MTENSPLYLLKLRRAGQGTQLRLVSLRAKGSHHRLGSWCESCSRLLSSHSTNSPDLIPDPLSVCAQCWPLLALPSSSSLFPLSLYLRCFSVPFFSCSSHPPKNAVSWELGPDCLAWSVPWRAHWLLWTSHFYPLNFSLSLLDISSKWIQWTNLFKSNFPIFPPKPVSVFCLCISI